MRIESGLKFYLSEERNAFKSITDRYALIYQNFSAGYACFIKELQKV